MGPPSAFPAMTRDSFMETEGTEKNSFCQCLSVSSVTLSPTLSRVRVRLESVELRECRAVANWNELAYSFPIKTRMRADWKLRLAGMTATESQSGSREMNASGVRPEKSLWWKAKHSRTSAVVKFVLVILAILWLMARGTEGLGYLWQWYRVPKYIFTIVDGEFVAGPILKGLGVTLNIVWMSLILAFLLGLLTALFRLSNSFMARVLARGYLETIRNSPMLVQLFFIYFVLGPIFDIERTTAAILSLSIFEGAYASEIFRAGIVSIHKGQWEASHRLGLSTFHTYRHVILPQAIRRVLPPLTSQAISLIKDSALVSTIAVYEMTMQARAIIAQTFLTFEMYFTIAAIYLLLTVTLSIIVNIMEHRLKVYT
jgi:polar amino acid transport system permease protein